MFLRKVEGWWRVCVLGVKKTSQYAGPPPIVHVVFDAVREGGIWDVVGGSRRGRVLISRWREVGEPCEASRFMSGVY